MAFLIQLPPGNAPGEAVEAEPRIAMEETQREFQAPCLSLAHLGTKQVSKNAFRITCVLFFSPLTLIDFCKTHGFFHDMYFP